MMKLVLVVIGVVALIGAGVYAAIQLSPWPSVLLIVTPSARALRTSRS